jgi:murein L,D-transpeptidase YafK
MRTTVTNIALLTGLAVVVGTTTLFWLNRSSKPTSPRIVFADYILVEKAARQLTLFANDRVVKTYRIALGGNPIGHKLEEGDQRTPEGIYTIDWRNPESDYHLSLHVSYPEERDCISAAQRGVPAGYDIMIHGLPNGTDPAQTFHPATDWTSGCIAVTDAEMDEIWALVPDGTTIEIRG